MNWCQPHWTLLRETIKEKGLDQFGAKDAEEALNEIAPKMHESMRSNKAYLR